MTGSGPTPALPARLAALQRSHIGEHPDFPSPGILFRDITPLLRDAAALREVIRYWATLLPEGIDVVVGTEARGFMLGAPLAYEIGAGFVPARKAGKLPGRPASLCYDLEYGSAAIELPEGALTTGVRVLVLDDLLATGGTAAATVELVRRTGAKVLGASFLIELTDLDGRAQLPDVPISVLWRVEG